MKMIAKFLEQRHSKKDVIRFVRYIGDDQKKFDQLVTYCFGDDERTAQLASWPVGYCVEAHPELLIKHIRKVLNQLKKPCHNSIKRCFTRSLVFVEIPKRHHAETISVCFELLNRKDEFVAIKVFSMTLLGKFCKAYPELKEELKALITAQLPFETAAFTARAKMVLKVIK